MVALRYQKPAGKNVHVPEWIDERLKRLVPPLLFLLPLLLRAGSSNWSYDLDAEVDVMDSTSRVGSRLLSLGFALVVSLLSGLPYVRNSGEASVSCCSFAIRTMLSAFAF
ncbi:hypothetical protein WH47_08390 [Habropoda laboriosa]|uniref:Uncharacterized protein n=1 Tax=Habropoda laboriosa TaxID=597456 RepID=A0A0L7RH41_9HYME|nr:hypothetical protein WH47_08390 [Habropoda laboriosa]